MRKVILAALLALVAVSAYAEQWKLIESSENHTLHFMDESSVTRKGTAAEYWEKSVYPRPHYTDGHIAYRAVKQQYLARCREESQVTIAQVFYDGDGHIVGQTDTPPDARQQGHQPVIPGSYQEWMLEYACHPPAQQAKINSQGDLQ